MAKKETKKISVNTIDKIMKPYINKVNFVSFNTDDETVEVEVKETISFMDFCALVNEIVSNVIIDGEYNPFVEEFAIRRGIITYYTNLTEPQLNKLYSLCMCDSIMNLIIEKINHTQLSEIYNSVNKSVKYQLQQLNTSRPTALDGLFVELTDAISKVKEKFIKDFKTSDLKDILPVLKDVLPLLNNVKEKDLADAMVRLNTSKNEHKHIDNETDEAVGMTD